MLIDAYTARTGAGAETGTDTRLPRTVETSGIVTVPSRELLAAAAERAHPADAVVIAADAATDLCHLDATVGHALPADEYSCGRSAREAAGISEQLLLGAATRAKDRVPCVVSKAHAPCR